MNHYKDQGFRTRPQQLYITNNGLHVSLKKKIVLNVLKCLKIVFKNVFKKVALNLVESHPFTILPDFYGG